MIIADSSQSNWRLKLRWLILVLVAALVIVPLGGLLIFRDVFCPKIYWLGLLSVSGVLLALFLLIWWRAREQPIQIELLAVAAYVALVLIPVVFLTPFIYNISPGVRDLCPGCPLAPVAADLVSKSYYDSAVDQGLKCINQTTDPACAVRCANPAVRGLVKMAASLREQQKYDAALNLLATATAVNGKYGRDAGLNDFVDAERGQTEKEKVSWLATRLVSPTPVPPPPTATNTPVPPPTATNTPVPPPTATNTPVPPPPTATNTPVPPPPTATNTPVPPTPIRIPVATIELINYCRATVIRVTGLRQNSRLTELFPHTPVQVGSSGDIDIIGAVYMPGHVSYQVEVIPIDEAGLPKRSEWTIINGRKDAPVGNDSQNVTIATWTEEERRTLAKGRYALFLRTLDAQSQYTVERDYEKCWAWIDLP